MSHSGYLQVGLILKHVGKNVENQPEPALGDYPCTQSLLEVWGVRAQRERVPLSHGPIPTPGTPTGWVPRLVPHCKQRLTYHLP